jgi:hypothetical protein
MTVVTAPMVWLTVSGTDNGIRIGAESDRRQVRRDIAAGIKPSVMFMYGTGCVCTQKGFQRLHGFCFLSRQFGNFVQSMAECHDFGKNGIVWLHGKTSCSYQYKSIVSQWRVFCKKKVGIAKIKLKKLTFL